jgi:hypothetical protein
MIARYFKGIQPHINIAEIEAEIAFLPGPPERAGKGYVRAPCWALLAIWRTMSTHITTRTRNLYLAPVYKNKALEALENAITVAVGAVNYLDAV